MILRIRRILRIETRKLKRLYKIKNLTSQMIKTKKNRIKTLKKTISKLKTSKKRSRRLYKINNPPSLKSTICKNRITILKRTSKKPQNLIRVPILTKNK